MTEQQLAEIEARLKRATKDLTLHLPDCVSSIAYTNTGMTVRMTVAEFREEESKDFEGRTAKLLTGTQKGNAELFANATTDMQDLIAEVKRLQERLRYEETCHAEAVQEVKRLNRMVALSCKILGDVPGICLDEKGMRKFLESEVAE